MTKRFGGLDKIELLIKDRPMDRLTWLQEVFPIWGTFLNEEIEDLKLIEIFEQNIKYLLNWFEKKDLLSSKIIEKFEEDHNRILEAQYQIRSSLV